MAQDMHEAMVSVLLMISPLYVFSTRVKKDTYVWASLTETLLILLLYLVGKVVGSRTILWRFERLPLVRCAPLEQGY
jgi:hypothetical protein